MSSTDEGRVKTPFLRPERLLAVEESFLVPRGPTQLRAETGRVGDTCRHEGRLGWLQLGEARAAHGRAASSEAGVRARQLVHGQVEAKRELARRAPRSAAAARERARGLRGTRCLRAPRFRQYRRRSPSPSCPKACQARQGDGSRVELSPESRSEQGSCGSAHSFAVQCAAQALERQRRQGAELNRSGKAGVGCACGVSACVRGLACAARAASLPPRRAKHLGLRGLQSLRSAKGVSARPALRRLASSRFAASWHGPLRGDSARRASRRLASARFPATRLGPLNDNSPLPASRRLASARFTTTRLCPLRGDSPSKRFTATLQALRLGLL